ncbi:LPXTG cell wall anchor domain-containing protein [Corynebacterium lizhenjunii]|uniref:LPXTG cell wall anchor domain-containing protein n=1 Tax=Corynebacterium lizhenjunii TaxID=2709394 RepID=A0A7T0KFN8_9CORY|nr:Ig-like domain-containing protein [Corynebacterium lizhenjunii]QPK78828.1 LPXTG cell wall anchor domain-containing protein [Corynebacterium lizhenjunii]
MKKALKKKPLKKSQGSLKPCALVVAAAVAVTPLVVVHGHSPVASAQSTCPTATSQLRAEDLLKKATIDGKDNPTVTTGGEAFPLKLEWDAQGQHLAEGSFFELKLPQDVFDTSKADAKPFEVKDSKDAVVGCGTLSNTGELKVVFTKAAANLAVPTGTVEIRVAFTPTAAPSAESKDERKRVSFTPTVNLELNIKAASPTTTQPSATAEPTATSEPAASAEATATATTEPTSTAAATESAQPTSTASADATATSEPAASTKSVEQTTAQSAPVDAEPTATEALSTESAATESRATSQLSTEASTTESAEPSTPASSEPTTTESVAPTTTAENLSNIPDWAWLLPLLPALVPVADFYAKGGPAAVSTTASTTATSRTSARPTSAVKGTSSARPTASAELVKRGGGAAKTTSKSSKTKAKSTKSTKAKSTKSKKRDKLADTGASVKGLLVMALLLILAGAGLLTLRRRES